MSKVALVERKDAFLAHGLDQAVETALVKVAGLVVHPRHNRVFTMIISESELRLQNWIPTRGMHDTAHDEAGCRATRQMQGRAVFQVQVLDQVSLREKVRGELHRASKARPHHGGIHTAVKSAKSLGGLDLSHSV